jgi:maltooligosyltrehalose trehalohydrolase
MVFHRPGSSLRPAQFIVCLQNHDQIGNRALGERLNHQLDPATYRALSALLLCAPQTPLLFMGQEWAASTPFLYFTDYHEELGRRITEGRRNEFRQFRAFADPAARDRIPDPQDDATFARSTLVWSERDTAPHTRTLRLYQALLWLRRNLQCICGSGDAESTAVALDEHTILMLRRVGDSPAVIVIVRLRHAGVVAVPDWAVPPFAAEPCAVILTTEDPAFTDAGRPPRIRFAQGQPATIEFAGPSAIILRGTPIRHR